MRPALNVRVHDSADASAQATGLATAVAAQLRTAIAKRGLALLAVSGGRSPQAFFQALRRQPLPWERVSVVTTDERCVPAQHSDSNARLVREHLLQELAGPARLLSWFETLPAPWHDPPEDAELQALAQQAQSHMAAAPWPLDVLVLGMGEDGHTASLFAQAAGLRTALKGPASVAWVRPQQATHARLTLTLPVLQRARHAHLALAGAAKQAMLARAMAHLSDKLPVSHVLHRPGRPMQVWRAP